MSDRESPGLFSFEGEAARMVDGGAYWVAVERNGTAPLLVGLPANAIGGVPTPAGRLSPTAGPLPAARAAFEDSSEKTTLPMQLPALLSYIWQTVSEPLIQGGLGSPRIQGLAVFAGFDLLASWLGKNARLLVSGFSRNPSMRSHIWEKI